MNETILNWNPTCRTGFVVHSHWSHFDCMSLEGSGSGTGELSGWNKLGREQTSLVESTPT